MKQTWGVIVLLVLLFVLALGAGATKPSVDVSNVNFMISEKGKTGSEYSLVYGTKLQDGVRLTVNHTMTISFEIKDPKTQKPIRPHQVFLRLFSDSTNEEFVLIPSSKKSDLFKVVIDMQKHAQSVFDFNSGLYSMELIVGDVNFAVPMLWNLGSIAIDFAGHPSAPASSESKTESRLWSPLPEIKHVFRTPEKRAPRFISRIFTLITLCPWIFLVIGLIRYKANISGLFSSGADFIFAIGFQTCILALIGVLVLYWLQINIFQAAGWLTVIGIVTFLVGTRALGNTAVAQLKEKTA